jgi:hypothetical protein
MKRAKFAALCILLLTSQLSGQATSSSVAEVFNSLGASRIDNEIMIPDPLNPRIVVLYHSQDSGESLSLISLDHGNLRIEWHLTKLPEFMEVVSPADLEVTMTGNGPVIMLHGCARHLCGGEGLAGALTYVVNEHRLYSAYANWSSSTKTTQFVYSPDESGHPNETQKKLLDAMLRDEGYKP